MIGLGPFSIHLVAIAIGAIVSLGVASALARRLALHPSASAGWALLDAFFWGLLAARFGYIVRNWEDYATTPKAVLAVGDGGFTWWVGLFAAAIALWLKTRSGPALRKPAFGGMLAGIAIWLAAMGAVDSMYRYAPPLPDSSLMTMANEPISLKAYTGRPVVLNLWASWCPPCRREMPVFEMAQKTYPDIAFVAVNQGESQQQVKAFIEHNGLTLDHVLLDPFSTITRTMSARGLPTTLFFDPEGRMVDSHVGELTSATLRDKLSRHDFINRKED